MTLNKMGFAHLVISILAFSTAWVQGQSEIASTETIYSLRNGEITAKQYYYDARQNGLLPWFQAMEWCQSNGFEPGRIENAAENALVARTLNEQFQTSRVFWLGASDWGQDGRFYWIQTGQVFSYHNFAASYPNGGLPESCAYVWGDGLWYDQYCTVAEVRPLCQKDV